ncbi:glycosyltransferase [Gordonia sp. zg691]|nr:glycosyltransferase [Gordonia jinghuaiqii]
MPRAARRADIVFATSKTEGKRIRDALGSRALVVEAGMGVRQLSGGIRTPGIGHDLQPGLFLLTVGRLNVRKNLRNTIRGYLASDAPEMQIPLVVVGRRDGRLEESDFVLAEAEKARLVRFVDYVDDAELGWLYENCLLFIFLSLGEGFGLPPVEARLAGAPVLSSDLQIFRETLGDSARYVDPYDVDSIGSAVSDFVHNRVAQLAPLGDESYSWAAVVSRIRAAYESIY